MYGIHHHVILVTYVYILYTVDLTQYALLPSNRYAPIIPLSLSTAQKTPQRSVGGKLQL